MSWKSIVASVALLGALASGPTVITRAQSLAPNGYPDPYRLVEN